MHSAFLAFTHRKKNPRENDQLSILKTLVRDNKFIFSTFKGISRKIYNAHADFN